MTAPLVVLGGRGPVIHLAPANGFPPQSYLPLLQPLFAHYRVVSLPPRALWPGVGDPPLSAGSWESLAEDLLEGMDVHGLGPVIAMGHSFGAVASLVAAERQPDRFRGLALLDPTILSPARMDQMADQRAQQAEVHHHLVLTTLNRRRRFASVADAQAYWSGRPLFRDWPEPAMRAYVQAMLRPAGDGVGFELTWRPEWEAWYYRSFYPGTWDNLERLDRRIPVLVARGETSDTYLPDAAAVMRKVLPDGTHITIPGAGHLFPHSAPDATRSALLEWLSQLPAIP
jgi:pimeloyl-ACP methyl ester carboxylesterase